MGDMAGGRWDRVETSIQPAGARPWVWTRGPAPRPILSRLLRDRGNRRRNFSYENRAVIESVNIANSTLSVPGGGRRPRR